MATVDAKSSPWRGVAGVAVLLALVITAVTLTGLSVIESLAAIVSAVVACLPVLPQLRRSLSRHAVTPRIVVSGRQSLAAPLSNAPMPLRGRQTETALLRAALRRPRDRMVVLTGMGGAGKTAIALDLVRWALGRRRTAWWISARTSESFVEGLVSLIETLGGTLSDSDAVRAGAGRARDRLWDLLRRAPRGWLLVFDDADDLGVLGPLDGSGWIRPSGRGLVLITSRVGDHRLWGAGARVVRVAPLPEGDAARVLLDVAQGGSEQEALELARYLAGLPLALRLAGSAVGSDLARWSSFAAYQDALRHKGMGRLLTEEEGLASGSDPRRAVTSTWELSLDSLDRAGVPQARELLRLLSCYAPGLPIPVSLLEAEPLHRLLGTTPGVDDDGRRLDAGLLGLLQLNLITRESVTVGETTATCVRLHPVVAETNRLHLDRGTNGPLLRQTAVDVIVAALLPLRFDHHQAWPFVNHLIPHVRQLLATTATQLGNEHVARLLTAAARIVAVKVWSGAEPAGERLAAEALDFAETLEAHHPVRLELLTELAWAIGRNGRWEEARTQLTAVVAAWSSRAEPVQAALLDARHKAAWAIGKCGNWQAAREQLEAIHELRCTLLGHEHPDTLHSLCCLAWATWRTGDGKTAERVYLRVIEARRRVLGDDDVEVMDAYHSLAEGYVMDGRFADAESLLRRLLDQRARILPVDHPETLDGRPRYWLGRALLGQGKRAEADRVLVGLLEDQIRALGADHPATAATRAVIAS